MSKILQLKRAIAQRIYKYLYYWSVGIDSTSDRTIELLRQRGLKIGTDVAIFDSDLDPLYPELITIGSRVTITHAVILTHDDSAVLLTGRRRVAPVVIGNNVFIGWNALILPGITIGDDCIIAAGSIVTKNVPNNSVVAGNPAKVIRQTSEYRDRILESPDLLPVQLAGNLPNGKQEDELKKYVWERFHVGPHQDGK